MPEDKKGWKLTSIRVNGAVYVTCTVYEQPHENIYTKFDSSVNFNICLVY